ncbi:MAG: DUF4982 domain-containing protein [Lachnospiraceae bacterium]|nr:DUF4982 domain-containing protein [Lachnospiraceae bacterium]
MTKRELFTDNWSFAKVTGEIPEDLWEFSGAPAGVPARAAFSEVRLPHDWQIGEAADLYEDSIGWYQRTLTLSEKPGPEERISLYFEGVYMCACVYVNGVKAGENRYGYSSFEVDMTALLRAGENEILVRAEHRSPNSRWYSGAGIYRDVYLIRKSGPSFREDSLYVHAEPEDPDILGGGWKITADITPEQPFSGAQGDLFLRFALPEAGIASMVPISMARADGSALAGAAAFPGARAELQEKAFGETLQAGLFLTGPKLWSPESPNLYAGTLELLNEKGTVYEHAEFTLGFRYLTFDPETGMRVNGEPIKLRGVCEHHDLGALGAAFHPDAMRRKLEILRTMGVNAIRCSHNMPAPGLLQLADEMGFFVIDEAFDMWEHPKTDYDYARFFPEWQERDVASWVRRDRNHPCIFAWSIGNEIYDTHASERGEEVTCILRDEARSHDPLGNARITSGSNYMPWKGAQRCATHLELVGYNYGEVLYDAHHAAHPDWVIYGSETSSTVQSRGIYHFPYSAPVLADEDLQCSSLGNSTTSWGAKNSEYCIIAERDHAFSFGQFLWTGFDYIGEPTPYHTRNSYFGQIDTAGFAKDSFYLYRSDWVSCDEEPFVHLFPYWDWNEGQLIDLRAATNAPETELFLNGRSLGRQRIDHAHGSVLTGNWQVPYEPGEIRAVAYDENGEKVAECVHTSFGEAKALLTERYAFRTAPAGREEAPIGTRAGDLVFVSVQAVDEQGRPVENANARVHISCGEGLELLGLDNGDSTDTDEYVTEEKQLFGGKLLAVLRVTDPEKSQEVRAEYVKGRVPMIRKIELTAEGPRTLTKDTPEVLLRAKILPPEADTPENRASLIWKAVTDTGIESPLAQIGEGPDAEAAAVRIMGIGDGAFRVRCMSKCGADCVKVISSLEFSCEGLGEARLDPYGFVAGGMYSCGEGELGNGNEHGVSTSRTERSVVGFERLDFGDFGSDEVTVQIFELAGDPCPFEIWDGMPDAEGSERLAQVLYHKPSIWNVYQPETVRLSRRLRGVRTLSFVFTQKVHLGGFSFARPQKAYEKLLGSDRSAVYGDAFREEGTAIRGIGNNVTAEFAGMDFGETGSGEVILCGSTPLPKVSIHLLFEREGEPLRREILEFTGSEKETENRFTFAPFTGEGCVKLLFLPGTQFDLEWLRFMREEN